MVLSIFLLPLRYYYVSLPVILVGLGIAYYVFTYANPYAPQGFRNAEFGTHLFNFPNMVKVEGNLEAEVYVRKYENLVFHGIELSEVKYIFSLRRLKIIQIYPKTDRDWKQSSRLLREKIRTR